MRRPNFAYVSVLLVLIAVGLLATTPVADAVLRLMALNLSDLTSAYSQGLEAIGSALTLGTVTLTPRFAWLSLNTFLGSVQAGMSAVALIIELSG